MLDYDNYMIQELIRKRGWRELPEFERILSIYNYIRDEILFGYNVDDSIPCRVHGFTIKKELQEGAMTGFIKKLAFRYYGRHMMNRNVRRVRGGF